jgi:small conductance mechanosensitive channel
MTRPQPDAEQPTAGSTTADTRPPVDPTGDPATDAGAAPPEPDALVEVEQASSNLIEAVSAGDLSKAADAAQGLVYAALPVATNLLVGALILIAAVLLSKRARSLVTKVAMASRIDDTLSLFFGQVARWGVLTLGVIVAIGKIGIPTASFVAMIGGASLAIGLAFQGSLGNLAAGVMLLIFRPFKNGDVVQVAGVTARVAQIDLFTTLLDTFDNRRVTMPNGNIFGTQIENLTFHPTRRVDVSVGTSYSTSIDAAREVLDRVARGVRGGLSDPPAQVYLDQLGDSSVDWVVRVWAKTADYWDVRERLTRDCKEALEAAGITIPYPQLDVHLRRVDAPE